MTTKGKISCPNCGLEYQVVEGIRVECSCGTVFVLAGSKFFDRRFPNSPLKQMVQVIVMPSNPTVKTYTVICNHMSHGKLEIGVFLEWTLAICPKCGSEYTAYTTIPAEIQETLYTEVVCGLW